ncbi:MAG: hypothetical protein J0H19_08455, partial [Rhodospirillales bacterium]|nr:hypothetical protein [Rhodospirillales bacterium]
CQSIGAATCPGAAATGRHATARVQPRERSGSGANRAPVTVSTGCSVASRRPNAARMPPSGNASARRNQAVAGALPGPRRIASADASMIGSAPAGSSA